MATARSREVGAVGDKPHDVEVRAVPDLFRRYGGVDWGGGGAAAGGTTASVGVGSRIGHRRRDRKRRHRWRRDNGDDGRPLLPLVILHLLHGRRRRSGPIDRFRS